MSFSFRIPTLGAVLVLGIGAAVGGCGGDNVPENGVAKVADADGDGVITTAAFDRWVAIAARRSAQAQAPGAAPTPVFDAPNFTRCVASKQKTAPKPEKGKPKTTGVEFKTQCRQEWELLRDQALGYLVAAEWVRGEAKARDITLSDEDVDQAFAAQKQQAFPKPADYEKFLKQSGSTEDDLRAQIEIEQLQQKLVADVSKSADKVTRQDVAEYYKENRQQFGAPASRDVLVILTKTREQADRAKAALARGESWAAVAKRSSLDVASKDRGGKLQSVTKGQQLEPIDEVVFAAKENVTGGPVKTQFGYYLYRVTSVRKGNQQSMREATPTIERVLLSQNRQKAVDAFLKEFRARWTARTNCREGYVIAECRNAKAPKNQTATAARTTPSSSPTS